MKHSHACPECGQTWICHLSECFRELEKVCKLCEPDDEVEIEVVDEEDE